MKQCENGHIYDEKAYPVCPCCSEVGLSVVHPLDAGSELAIPIVTPIDSGSAPTAPVAPAAPARPKKEMSATIALNVSDAGVACVCGWLVGVEGDNKGLSFPVHSEKNIIGRGSNFDIDLSFDKAISKEGDAVITFDSRGKKFYVTLGSGKNNVYHNSVLLLAPEEVKDYDVIEAGSTKMVFRSFCNDEFTY